MFILIFGLNVQFNIFQDYNWVWGLVHIDKDCKYYRRLGIWQQKVGLFMPFRYRLPVWWSACWIKRSYTVVIHFFPPFTMFGMYCTWCTGPPCPSSAETASSDGSAWLSPPADCPRCGPGRHSPTHSTQLQTQPL